MWNDDYGGVGVLDVIMLFPWPVRQQASLIDARAARLRKGKVPAADAICAPQTGQQE